MTFVLRLSLITNTCIVRGHALEGQGSFERAKPSCRRWEVWENEDGADGEENCERAFDIKEPSTGRAVNNIQEIGTRYDKSADLQAA